VQFGAQNRGGKEREAERRCRGNERASSGAVMDREGVGEWRRCDSVSSEGGSG
jgi:hypothetical protein